MHKKILNIIIVTALTVILSCSGKDKSNDTTADTTSPSEVSSPSYIQGDKSFVLIWTDPADTDYDHAVITCGSVTKTVLPGAKKAIISGLTPSTLYSYKIQTVDSSGNTSAGVAGYVTTSATKTSYSLTISFQYGTTPPHTGGSGKNVYAIWIENSDRSFIQNLYICTRLTDGSLTGTALPYWKTKVYTDSDCDSTEVNAVTGATAALQDFTVIKSLKDLTKRQFTVYYETDQSYEPNDWFAKNQPAILYSAYIDIDDVSVTSYELTPAGWTADEATIVSGNIPFSGLTFGTFITEMRYITNYKDGSGFGATDTARSATQAVEKITLTIE